MRKSVFAFIAFIVLLTAAGCNDAETYAEQRDRENSAISRFIRDSSITVIDEDQFREQGFTTDTSQNQFVLLQSSGVYMQIVREGCGEQIHDGETTTVLCRFTERNLLTDSIQLTNNILSFSSIVDKMTVTNNGGTFTASFIEDESIMARVYRTTSVPAGWLVPLAYIKVGRQTSPDEEIAKVNLIVPSTQGQANASSNVYPCYYTITYQRGR